MSDVLKVGTTDPDDPANRTALWRYGTSQNLPATATSFGIREVFVYGSNCEIIMVKLTDAVNGFQYTRYYDKSQNTWSPSWTLITPGYTQLAQATGSQSKNYTVGEYKELLVIVFIDVNGTLLTFTNILPQQVFALSNPINLRGGGGYGSEVNNYQILISATGIQLQAAYVNGTSYLSTSSVYLFGR